MWEPLHRGGGRGGAVDIQPCGLHRSGAHLLGQLDHEARCGVQGSKRVVATIAAGGYFGEVALVTHAPRAADVVAASDSVRLLSMGRDAFQRLMGTPDLVR